MTDPNMTGHWFTPSGDANADVNRLVTLLLDERARYKEGDPYSDALAGVKMGGVIAAYRQGMDQYASIVDFVAACDKLTQWADDPTTALIDLWELRGEVAKFPRLTMVDIAKLRQDAKDLYEVGAKGITEEYDIPYALKDHGMWTDHMGPCITVGFTARSADGLARYNTLLHSFKDIEATALLDSLVNLFNGKPKSGQTMPLYATLQQVSYYVMGGSPDAYSVSKAIHLLLELSKRNLSVLGIALTNEHTYSGMTKAVMITPDGKVFGSVYKAG